MEQEFKDRINLNTDLSNISKQICIKYELGDYISDSIITVGYEDFDKKRLNKLLDKFKNIDMK